MFMKKRHLHNKYSNDKVYLTTSHNMFCTFQAVVKDSSNSIDCGSWCNDVKIILTKFGV